MSSRRVLKAAQAIREVVSMAIIADLKDPRIRDVTVTLVEVAPDMRQAKVNVSVMGDETKQKLCIRGLQNSAGYLQQKVGKRIDTRYTPRLQFVLDQGIKHAMLVTRILDEVIPMGGDDADSVDDNTTESEQQAEGSPADAVIPNDDESGPTDPATVNQDGTTDHAEDPT
jgi:ribosome-binding factor A